MTGMAGWHATSPQLLAISMISGPPFHLWRANRIAIARTPATATRGQGVRPGVPQPLARGELRQPAGALDLVLLLEAAGTAAPRQSVEKYLFHAILIYLSCLPSFDP
jgi:hypothetical protein